MLAFVRAAFAAALVLLLSVPAIAADKPFKRDDLADAAIKLEAQIKAEAGQVAKPAAALRREADAAFQRNDFRSGMQILGQIVAVAPDDSANWLRLATGRAADPPEQRPRAHDCCSSAPRPPPTSPISAPAIAGEEADSLRGASARSYRRSPALAAGARCAAPLARAARGRRGARSNTSACARITASACSTTRSMPMPPRRAPASSSPRTCRASAPTSRRSSPSPARTSRRCRSQDRQLCVEGLKHGERYTITLRAGIPSTVQGDAVEVRRLQHLCARPQAARALHRQGLCAAAHRPARHSGGQRQHRGGGGRDLPHRRPQPARHRARPRLPAQPRPLRRRAPGRGARLAGLEGRAGGRADAQRRRHHRVPGRPGGRRARARRLCHGGAGRRRDQGRVRCARDPVVHRLRPRPDRLLRQ